MTPLAAWPEPTIVGSGVSDPARSTHEVIELQLLLPRWQAAELEKAATTRGMTTGQILRRVIADLFPPGSGR